MASAHGVTETAVVQFLNGLKGKVRAYCTALRR
jgi:hypothetical protein